jgi:hypothetical protein
MANRMKISLCFPVYGSAFALVIGCGAAPPVASEKPTLSAHPAAKPVATTPAQEDGGVASSDAPESGSTEENPTSATPKAEGLRKASRPPAELITNPTVLYVFNFKESEVGQSAQEQCSTASEGDSGAMAACMQKARGKVPVESVRFKKKGNEYFWVTLNRYKGNLLKWHIIPFQVGEEKDDRVTLKPFGKDKGIAPMAKIPKSLEIELPNDYSIIIKDPEFGKMVFDAKIGAIDED